MRYLGLPTVDIATDGDKIPAEHPDQQKPEATVTKFTHNSLWNEAYDALKKEKESGKLVETYEKILWKVFLQPAASDKATQNEQDEEKVMKTLAQDASSREEQ